MGHCRSVSGLIITGFRSLPCMLSHGETGRAQREGSLDEHKKLSNTPSIRVKVSH